MNKELMCLPRDTTEEVVEGGYIAADDNVSDGHEDVVASIVHGVILQKARQSREKRHARTLEGFVGQSSVFEKSFRED